MATAPTPGIGRRLAAAAAYEERVKAQVVAVRFDDALIEVRDLPVDILTRIARRNATDWVSVIDSPAHDLNVARDVIEAAAGLLDVKAPPLDTGRQMVAAIRKCIQLVDDDLPDLPYVEGSGENPTDATSMAG